MSVITFTILVILESMHIILTRVRTFRFQIHIKVCSLYCLDIILNGVAFILKVVPIVSALLSLHAKSPTVTRPGVCG